jgi:streptogramin lyase
MRSSCVGMIALVAIGATIVLGIPSVSQSRSLTLWNLPYETAFPGGLALGADGTVYVTASGGREICRLDPASDVYRSWGVGEHPVDVTVVNGVVFCTVRQANTVVFFDPAGLSVSSRVLPFPDVGPSEIHRGINTSTGNMVLWIAEWNALGVVRYEYNPATDEPAAIGTPSELAAQRGTVAVHPQTVTTAYERFSYDVTLIPPPITPTTKMTSASFTEWTLPVVGDFFVEDIAVAHDGTLWISFGGPSLFRLDPVAETIQEMETIQNVAIFRGLLPAADGSIWFGNFIEGAIGHFDPAIGLSEVWRIPGTGEVYDLAFDKDGGIWYTDRVGGAIGRLDVWTGEATVYPLPEGSEPLCLAIDADNAVWFTAGTANYIGRLTTVD